MLEFLQTMVEVPNISLIEILITLFGSIIYGIVISLVYIYCHKKEGYEASFVLTLVILTTIISMIILLIGNNAAKAFSLAGAFSIIRFRNVLGNSEDMGYVLFSLAVGLMCGIGFVGFAAIFVAIIAILLIMLKKMKFGISRYKTMNLKILIPENLNYDGVFDEVLEKYTKQYFLRKIKTEDFGSTFELYYRICLSNDIKQKEFIDELRKRNGNLNITLSMHEYEN